MDTQSINLDKYKNMVICSTLNQMVNYIPIMKHGVEKVFVLTDKNSIPKKHRAEKVLTYNSPNIMFNQEKWNENLEGVLGGKLLDYIPYKVNEMTNIANIVNHIQYSEIEGPTIWNITGGQRYLIMSILKYLQENKEKTTDDVILYFDGDLEKFYYYNSNFDIIYPPIEIHDSIFNSCPLNIEIALSLMGFDYKKNKERSKIRKVMLSKDQGRFDSFKKYLNESKEYRLYKNIYEKYLTDSTVEYIFMASNKNKVIDNYVKKETIDDKRLDFIVNFLSEANKLEKVFPNDSLEILQNDVRNNLKGYAFGYILEKMAYYQILKKLQEEPSYFNAVADIAFDYSIYTDFDNYSVDQFDILLLTKAGQLVVFECKSGEMDGDVAKSTHYSTYATSGVYGKPILITPINKMNDIDEKIKEEINKIANLNNEKSIDMEQQIKSTIQLTKKKGKKAQLAVKNIGELGSIIEDILK